MVAMPKNKTPKATLLPYLPSAVRMTIKPSHFETCVVSRGVLVLPDSWKRLPSLYRAVCPASYSSLLRIALFLAGCTDRHRFCSLSIYDSQKHSKGYLFCRWVGL
jgi:hypothetical protein